MRPKAVAAGLAFSLASAAGAQPPHRGAAGAWQRLLKLRTTASVLYVTAHPDDEHGDVLTWLSRGQGVRVVLVSLTRGEAGANAIGSELFDALGWVRAEELRLAGRYYGLDALTFTRLADYGYSKSLEEARHQWPWEEALADLVRIIRMEQPTIIISRFQGSSRDGHGQHRFAGVLAREAFADAADPSRFGEQLREGLRPWRAQKLYVGGCGQEEDWTLAVDTGMYCPWLGDSFAQVARMGLSLQRSQTSGRMRGFHASSIRYYKRVDGASVEKESDFFEGLDVSLPPEIRPSIDEALATFDWTQPSRSVPVLARALARTRRAIEAASPYPHRLRLLRIKERQIEAAIEAALAIDTAAVARNSVNAGESASTAAPRRAISPPVPGQSFEVTAELSSQSGFPIQPVAAELQAPEDWRVSPGNGSAPPRSAEQGAEASWTWRFQVSLPPDAGTWRPHLRRRSVSDTTYLDEGSWWLAAPEPMARAGFRYLVAGVEVESTRVVTRWEDHLPYGNIARELVVLPALSVHVEPSVVIVPVARKEPSFRLTVDVVNHRWGGSQGTVRLEMPEGWKAVPPRQELALRRAGESRRFVFQVLPGEGPNRDVTIHAVAESAGKLYREGFRPLEHRDLETRYDVRPSSCLVRPVDVRVAPGLRVGYVMGVGDELPAAIRQLGAEVTPLETEELARAPLDDYDAIVIGTRAYAVREDLRVFNSRLLDYARGGGNLIVLYNTPELRPREFAPFPGVLPPQPEEVSEEDAPVRILKPDHPVFNWPNRIGPEDFAGWVEQRGSKFWSRWDPAYRSLLSSHDRGQEPQGGGWLWARYGKGQYTYCAYALHRQLPYGVPGAFRLLANLLSLGRQP